MNPFIITCAARTGSTMLRYMLDSHPQIICHGEVFKRRGLKRFLKKDKRIIGLTPLYASYQEAYTSLTEQEFIDKQLLSSDDVRVKAVGFKFKTEEYFDPAFHKIGAFLKSRVDVKVVHLKRRDLLSQYISHQVVRKRKGATVSFSDDSSSRQFQRMDISIKDLLRFLKDVTRREDQIEKEFHEQDIFNCYYEEIIKKSSQSIADLQEFLSLTPEKLEKKTVKLIHDHYDLIGNKKEVISTLISSGYKERLTKAHLDV